jgi:hypothetical protein
MSEYTPIARPTLIIPRDDSNSDEAPGDGTGMTAALVPMRVEI